MTREGPVALRCVDLGKTYRLYTHPGQILREMLTGRALAQSLDALSGVSFEVRRGEVVGVLGRNGAGKSTLLRIVAGTLEPTSGTVEVNGRVTAILELGTGFHPDYSGRENIRLGGLCLGMSLAEVEQKADGIIDFSELREHIDQPFRTYSTGMQARLTFATAISVDPDILIVDEALSVGDARFQMKCFARLSALRARGCTILLVSHDINTITTFCDHAVILERGRVYAEGSAKNMASAYLRLLFDEPTSNSAVEQGSHELDTPDSRPARPEGETVPVHATAQGPAPVRDAAPVASYQSRFGDGSVRLLSWGLLDDGGREVRVLTSGQRCRIYLAGRFEQDVSQVSCGFAIKNRQGTVLFGVTNIARSEAIDDVRAGEVLTIETDLTMWLAAGDYFVNLGFAHAGGSMCDFIEDAVQFTVHGPGGIFTTAVVNLEADFRVTRTTGHGAQGVGA